MEKSNKLALYIGYFLARFDKRAYEMLNYGNQKKTHIRVGEVLEVNPNTVKNMRDEFDPLFGHRVGWYQRPLSPSREQVVSMMEDYSFEQVYALVTDILNSKGESYNSIEISSIVIDDEDTLPRTKSYTTRGSTGREAENLFKENYLQIIPTFDGDLIDTSLGGTGFDFKNSFGTKFIEVKGSLNDQKGILLTEKEWAMAKHHREKYYLVLVYSIRNKPMFIVLNDPFSKLKPEPSIQRTITFNWNVSNKEMNNHVGNSNLDNSHEILEKKK